MIMIDDVTTEPTRYWQLSTVMYRLCILYPSIFNRIHFLVIELRMTTLLIKKFDDDDDNDDFVVKVQIYTVFFKSTRFY